MTDRDDLLQKVRTAAADGPYVVEETPQGASNEVRWSGGADADGPPTLVAEATQQRGRVYEKSFAIETGVDARTHEIGTPVNYTFSSGEGRRLIRGAAQESGWSEQMGTEQKIGLMVAGITVALLVVVGLVALVIALIG